jgi:acyl-CoA synthetase (NDP forming)
LAIVTYSGAQGVLTADAVVNCGLELARFQSTTLEKLSQVITTQPKRQNPVDLFPDMLSRGFEKTTTEILKSLLEDDEVDGIVFISFAVVDPEHLRPLTEIIKASRSKPVFFSFLGNKSIMQASHDLLEAEQIPCVDYPEMAVRVFGNMWKFASAKTMTPPQLNQTK